MHRLLLSVVFIVIAVIGLATLPWSLMNGPLSSLVHIGCVALCIGLFAYFIKDFIPKKP